MLETVETLGVTLVFLGIVLIFWGLISGGRAETGMYYDNRGSDFEKDELEEFDEDRFGYETSKERKAKTKVKGAGIIMIGPIPIIVGDSKYAFYLGIIAIILMLLSIILMFSVF